MTGLGEALFDEYVNFYPLPRQQKELDEWKARAAKVANALWAKERGDTEAVPRLFIYSKDTREDAVIKHRIALVMGAFETRPDRDELLTADRLRRAVDMREDKAKSNTPERMAESFLRRVLDLGDNGTAIFYLNAGNGTNGQGHHVFFVHLAGGALLGKNQKERVSLMRDSGHLEILAIPDRALTREMVADILREARRDARSKVTA